MENNCEAIKTKSKKHLNRVKGQLNGIERMLDEKRDSLEIVDQISAIRASLSTLALDILRSECSECFNAKSSDVKQKKFEELVAKFFKVS